MRLSSYVSSQIIPKSRVVHLVDKQILKRHILSYPKIIASKNPRGWGWGGGGGFRYLAHGLKNKWVDKDLSKSLKKKCIEQNTVTGIAQKNRTTKNWVEEDLNKFPKKKRP